MRLDNFKLFAAAATLALGVLVTGCGGDDVKPASGGGDVATVDNTDESELESATAEAGADLPSDEDLKTYFNAVSAYDIEELESAMSLAEPGSIAEAYAGYILGSANAALDEGLPMEGEAPEKVDGGYKSCPSEDEADCVTWADVEGRDGRIVNFTVNGEDLSGRLSAGTGGAVKAGDLGSMKLLYAYQSVQSGALFVVAEVSSNDAPVTVAAYDATYRSPEGRQSKAAQTSGPSDLGANSSATVVMAFPQAEPGGTASVSFFSDDFMTEKVVNLKTR